MMPLVAAALAATPVVTTGGYVAPMVVATARPDAPPVDRWELGLGATRAGLDFRSKSLEGFQARVYLVLGSDLVSAVTSTKLADTDNDGKADTVSTSTAKVMANVLDEASLTWTPAEVVRVRAGRFRVPFTAQGQSPDTALLFPTRASPTGVFLEGSDLGVLVEWNAQDYARGSVGVFNGTGLSAGAGSSKGALCTARVDLSPLGAFAFNETSPERRPFRFGLGAALVWHPTTWYDRAGEPDVRVNDLRGAASVRISAGSLYLGAELLGRHETDTLTSRPVVAFGGYGQGGYALPVGVEPIARVGAVMDDLSFDPQTTAFAEAGLNAYPGWRGERPDVLKLSAVYQGEFRLTEGEEAHGLGLRAQLKF